MNRLLTVLLAIILTGSVVVGQEKAKPADPPPFRLAAYLPDFRAADFEPAAAPRTDLILFSAEPNAAGPFDLSRLDQMPWADPRAFKTKRRVRLVLCVGGWERSKHFAVVATSERAPAESVKTVVKVCLGERLDVDWEHPKDEAEQAGYASLLTELRAAFAPHGLVLSVTMAAWQKLPKAGFAAADWVNVIAYEHPDRHSTFDAAAADVKRCSKLGRRRSKSPSASRCTAATARRRGGRCRTASWWRSTSWTRTPTRRTGCLSTAQRWWGTRWRSRWTG